MTTLIRVLGLSAIGVAAISVSAHNASAAGAGCTALAGETVNVPGNFTAAEFEQGDELNFRISITSLPGGSSVDVFNLPAANIVTTTAGVFSRTASSSGSFTIGTNFGGPVGVATVTFIGCNTEGGRAAQAAATAKAFFTQQSGLVFGRTNRLVTNKPSNRATGPGAQTSALPEAGLVGGAGQGAGEAYGVWGDLTWSGVENQDATVGSDGHIFTLSGGYDTPINDKLLVGAAISFGGATFDVKANEDETTEFGFGVTPYVAYTIDDVFAVQAAAGYNHGAGRAKIAGVDGDYRANRYFVAGEASAFQSWDELSLFSSVGVLWGQSFQHSYDDDERTNFRAVKSQLGSLSVTAQPSYLFTIDEGDNAFIEPFFVGQYVYDFSRTKVAGAANDPDQFVLGIGANAFYGDATSGSLEFTRSIGREDNVENTARATVRMDF